MLTSQQIQLHQLSSHISKNLNTLKSTDSVLKRYCTCDFDIGRARGTDEMRLNISRARGTDEMRLNISRARGTD